MARLPVVGGDDNNWGAILNDFLSQAHDGVTGALKNDVVDTAQIKDGAITNAKIASSAAIAKTKLDSSTQASLNKADSAAAVYTYNSGTNSYVLAPSGRIFRGTVDPASVGVSLVAGDIWINTSGT